MECDLKERMEGNMKNIFALEMQASETGKQNREIYFEIKRIDLEHVYKMKIKQTSHIQKVLFQILKYDSMFSVGLQQMGLNKLSMILRLRL